MPEEALIVKRNLQYYVYPRRGPQWAWNVSRIVPYLNAFNGRIFVVVSQDDTTEPLSSVRQAFGDRRASFVEVRNDPSLGESVGFLPVMEMLCSTDPDEATFYAHAKGARHQDDSEVLGRVRTWIDCMLLLNLGSMEVVEGLMKRHSAIGCLRRIMEHQGSSWHYSGTFFWYKHSAIFSKDWTSISPGIYGVESYLGRHLPVSESYDLTRGREFGDLYKTTIPMVEITRMHEELTASSKRGAL
jgi:hypothetical protein